MSIMAIVNYFVGIYVSGAIHMRHAPLARVKVDAYTNG